MLDDFREWLSDNLRYILVGLAGILILVIAIFAVRLVSSFGSHKTTQTEAQQTTEAVTEAGTERAASAVLTQNDPAVLNLMERYYAARSSKDYETLATLYDSFDEEDQASIEAEDSVIENYSNIMTYSKAGLEEGSYIIYTYAELKITGIDTVAPTLREHYAVTNADNTLVLSDKESSQALIDYRQEMQSTDDVQALISDVNDQLARAKENDTDLAAFVDSRGDDSQTTASEDGTTDSSDAGDGTAATGTMVASTTVNVRGEASAESTLYGTLMEGMEVEVLDNLDSGWSHVRYTTSDGTIIEGYVMTQYLTAAAQ